MTDRETHYILRQLARSGNFVSLDLVEINPSLEDTESSTQVFHGDDPTIAGSATVRFGVELAKSAMGKTLTWKR